MGRLNTNKDIEITIKILKSNSSNRYAIHDINRNNTMMIQDMGIYFAKFENILVDLMQFEELN